MASQSLPRRDFLKQSAAATTVAVSPGFATTALTQSFKTQKEFAAYQQRRRKLLWSLLGELPLSHRPQPPRLIKTEKHPGYTLERLELDLNGIEPVPAPGHRRPAGLCLRPTCRLVSVSTVSLSDSVRTA